MNLRIEHKGVLFALIFLALYAPVFIQGVSQNNSSIAACERGNEGLRKPLFEFLTDARDIRLEQAAISEGEEKRVNERAAKNYNQQAEDMVTAAEKDGVLLEEGKPYVDCDAAYPAPFPLSLFE